MFWIVCLVFFVGILVGFWIREAMIGRDIKKLNIPCKLDGDCLNIYDSHNVLNPKKIRILEPYDPAKDSEEHFNQSTGPVNPDYEPAMPEGNNSTGFPDTEPPHPENKL